MGFDSNILDAWFIETKLHPPPLGFDLVKRPRLLKILDADSSKANTLLVAPAGFGKSSLLSQWMDSLVKSDVSVAWLSLDEDDFELRQFMSYVVLALTRAGAEMGRLGHAAEQMLADIPERRLLSALINTLSQNEKRVVLILDDFHRVQSDDIVDLVEELLLRSPVNFSIVVSSRSMPAMNVAGLVAQGRLFEMQANNLRLSKAEAHEILADDMPDGLASDLYDKTEGWAVALQLARLAVQNRLPSPGSEMPADEGRVEDSVEIDLVASRSTHIADYFAQQVFDQLSSELQDFLLRISLTERFNLLLARDLCPDCDVQRMITQVTNLRPLLIPLGTGDQWFRFHHLFAEFLNQRLVQRDDIDAAQLHIVASQWFEKHGQIAEAVRHARMGSDFDRCARLILDAGGWELILFGGIGHIRNLLRHVSEPEFDRHPRLRIARAYLRLKDGLVIQAQKDMDTVAKCSEVDQDELFQRDRTMISVLLAIYSRDVDIKEIRDWMLSELSAWDSSDTLGMGVLSCTLALTEIGLGNFKQARIHALEGVRQMRASDSVLGVNYATIHLAASALLSGDLELSEAEFGDAADMAEENFGSDSGLKAVSNLGQAALGFWRGEHTQLPDGFATVLESVIRGDGWFQTFVGAFEVQILDALARNDTAMLIEVVENARLAGRERDLMGLTEMADVYQLQHCTLRRDWDSASSLMLKLHAPASPEGWAASPDRWQIFAETVFAKAIYALNRGRQHIEVTEIEAALAYLKEIGALPAYLKILLIWAALQADMGKQDAATQLIFEGTKLALRERIIPPFLAQPAVRRQVRLAANSGRKDPDLRMEAKFLSRVVALFPAQASADGGINLSTRESEVLYELATGKSNKEIARALDMTHHTVKFHLKNLYAKLDAENRTVAVNRALKHGVIEL